MLATATLNTVETTLTGEHSVPDRRFSGGLVPVPSQTQEPVKSAELRAEFKAGRDGWSRFERFTRATALPRMKFPRAWWMLFVVVTIAGIVLRFTALDRKPFWYDEVFAALRAGGWRESEIKREVLAAGEWRPSGLLRFQKLNPQRGLRDALSSQAAEDPQLEPLHCALMWLWAGIAGDSVARLRMLSALLSLLALPAAWWFCRELFGADDTAPVAVTLFAVSPLMLVYAQEACSYSLWIVTILASSAALARALRLNTPWGWRFYAATAALGLYSHLFFVFVLVAHFVAARMSLRSREWSRAGLWTAVFFAPWAWIIVAHLRLVEARTSWSATPVEWKLYFGRLPAVQGLLLADFGNHVSRFVVPLVGIATVLGLAALFWRLWRRGERTAFWLLLVMWATPLMALMGLDLLFGGIRALVQRYLMPGYTAVLILIACGVARGWSRRPVRLAWIVLVATGLVSGVLIVRAGTWWNKGPVPLPEIVTRLNAASRPVLLFDLNDNCLGHLLALSRYLDDDVRVIVSSAPPRQLDGDVFAVGIADGYRKALVKEHRASVELIPIPSGAAFFWRIRPPTGLPVANN